MSGGQKLGRVRIRKGIFQGDLSPLLFCVSTNTHVVGVERSKGRVSVGRSTGKS